MAGATAELDSAQLRDRLLAAEPMQRVAALHELECQVQRGPRPAGSRLAQAVREFVARGMPFYSRADPHYLAWVDRAVAYWERLQRECASGDARATPREARTVGA
jgi:hypothetical protein